MRKVMIPLISSEFTRWRKSPYCWGMALFALYFALMSLVIIMAVDSKGADFASAEIQSRLASGLTSFLGSMTIAPIAFAIAWAVNDFMVGYVNFLRLKSSRFLPVMLAKISSTVWMLLTCAVLTLIVSSAAAYLAVKFLGGDYPLPDLPWAGRYLLAWLLAGLFGVAVSFIFRKLYPTLIVGLGVTIAVNFVAGSIKPLAPFMFVNNLQAIIGISEASRTHASAASSAGIEPEAVIALPQAIAVVLVWVLIAMIIAWQIWRRGYVAADVLQAKRISGNKGRKRLF